MGGLYLSDDRQDVGRELTRLRLQSRTHTPYCAVHPACAVIVLQRTMRLADSLTHAERQPGPRRTDARRRFGVSDFINMNGAAGAGHGDKLLTCATDEFAMRVASGRGECV